MMAAVQVSFPASPSWLQYPWDGANRQLARGLASFGIYRGAAPLIFRRELYRYNAKRPPRGGLFLPGV